MPLLIDVNDRTPPTPCQTEGCGHPRFHVCLFGTEDTFAELIARPKTRGPMSKEMRELRAEGQRARWERKRQKSTPHIIERYAEGTVGMHGLAKEFGFGVNTIRDILRQAEAEGKIKVRGKGENIIQRNESLERAIVERYKQGGISIPLLAETMGVGETLTRRVLSEAAEAGEIVIKPVRNFRNSRSDAA